eukprot:SAG31_NODE_36638_length_311_cov_1.198113_1_plen_100_part_01
MLPTDGTATSVSLTADTYAFFRVVVGPADETMSVSARSGPGSVGSMAAADDTWGTDWTETMTPTWTQRNGDEQDLDVELTVTVTAGSGDTSVYGSSTEVY